MSCRPWCRTAGGEGSIHMLDDVHSARMEHWQQDEGRRSIIRAAGIASRPRAIARAHDRATKSKCESTQRLVMRLNPSETFVTSERSSTRLRRWPHQMASADGLRRDESCRAVIWPVRLGHSVRYSRG